MTSSNLTNAVTVSNGQVTTSSLKIAEVFGKDHKHVLRDIEKLQVPDDFRKSNFGLSEYSSQNGIGKTVKYPMYNITRDGFTLLVMGFTGTKAMEFKIAYLEAFNAMESKLRELQAAPSLDQGERSRRDIPEPTFGQPELPMDAAPAAAGPFSALKYQGVEVIPAYELRKRLGATRGQFEAWLYSYRPMTDGVDVFRVHGVTDKLALAMIKAGYKVNPNTISLNLYTRSGFAKAASRFRPETVVPEAPPEVRPELPPPLELPRRDPEAKPDPYTPTFADLPRRLTDSAVGKLLKKLSLAGYDVDREIAETAFFCTAAFIARHFSVKAIDHLMVLTDSSNWYRGGTRDLAEQELELIRITDGTVEWLPGTARA